jgi:metallo-beta-lactamase family protein
MNVDIKFLGAAGSVTGSKYLLDIGDFRLLVDCGLFQGLKELRERNWDEFPVDPAGIQAVVLTHAHIDHSGYLPRLFKQGFQGPVYCTSATADLVRILLLDSAKLQEEEADTARQKGYSRHANPQPLYTTEDVNRVLPQLLPCPYHTEIPITESISLHFRDAGHILGSASLRLHIKGQVQEKNLVFSGDLGRYNQPILTDPQPFTQADILLIESTYGNRESIDHSPEERLAEVVDRMLARDGCLLIPAFALGRTQSLLYYLHRLMESGRIPSLPIYVDSPMAVSVTSLYRNHQSDHKLQAQELDNARDAFDQPQVHYVNDHHVSHSLCDIKRKAIIISASGMATGGRILMHLFHRLPRENDTVLFVGYQAEGTRGRRILDGEPSIRIYGEDVPIRCQIEVLDGLSAHADRSELFQWIDALENSPKRTFVVHGELSEAEPFARALREKKNWNVLIPQYLESFRLFEHI